MPYFFVLDREVLQTIVNQQLFRRDRRLFFGFFRGWTFHHLLGCQPFLRSILIIVHGQFVLNAAKHSGK